MYHDPTPLLSIVIATYRRPEPLRTLLDSICIQLPADRSVEVIVVDNGLDTNTAEVMQSFVSAYDAVQYVQRVFTVPMEESIMSARTYGTGEYLWALGDDDAIYPEAITRLLAHLRTYRPELVLLRHDSWSPDLQRHIVTLHSHILEESVSFSSFMEAVRELGWGVYIAYLGAPVFRADPFRDVDYTPYAHSPHVFAMALLEAFHATPCRYLRWPAIRYRTNSTLPYSESGLRVVTTVFAECFDAAVQRGWGKWRTFLDMREVIPSDHKLLYLRVHTLAACMLSNIWDRIKNGEKLAARETALFCEGYKAYGNVDMLELLNLLLRANINNSHERDAINLALGHLLIRENLNTRQFPRNFFAKISA